MPCGHVNGVGPRLGGPNCNPSRVLEIDATGEEIVGVEAKDDANSGDFIFNSTHNIKPKPGAVLQRAAPIIVSCVFFGRQEL